VQPRNSLPFSPDRANSYPDNKAVKSLFLKLFIPDTNKCTFYHTHTHTLNGTHCTSIHKDRWWIRCLYTNKNYNTATYYVQQLNRIEWKRSDKYCRFIKVLYFYKFCFNHCLYPHWLPEYWNTLWITFRHYKYNFLDRFQKKTRISTFTYIRPVAAELFHAGRQASSHESKQSL
jgi:hypothetical protein